MAKYIDADALNFQVLLLKAKGSEKNGNDTAHTHRIMDLIANAPPADVQTVIHGEWLDVNGEMDNCIIPNVVLVVGTCSNCKKKQRFDGQYEEFPRYCPPFCPLCGAKMNENNDEEQE